MALEKLKAIKQKIQDRVACKELYSVLTDSKEIELFNDCVSSIKNDGIGEEESNLLKDIYVGLNSIFIDISTDWDSNRGSLSSEQIIIHCQNLGSILEIVTIIKGLKTGWGRAYVIPGLDEPQLIRDVESLQNTMKEVLEKMQQQQLPQSATNQGNDVNEHPDDANENEYSKLEEEAKPNLVST